MDQCGRSGSRIAASPFESKPLLSCLERGRAGCAHLCRGRGGLQSRRQSRSRRGGAGESLKLPRHKPKSAAHRDPSQKRSAPGPCCGAATAFTRRAASSTPTARALQKPIGRNWEGRTSLYAEMPSATNHPEPLLERRRRIAIGLQKGHGCGQQEQQKARLMLLRPMNPRPNRQKPRHQRKKRKGAWGALDVFESSAWSPATRRPLQALRALRALWAQQPWQRRAAPQAKRAAPPSTRRSFRPREASSQASARPSSGRLSWQLLAVAVCFCWLAVVVAVRNPPVQNAIGFGFLAPIPILLKTLGQEKIKLITTNAPCRG